MQMCPFCGSVYDESEYTKCPYCNGGRNKNVKKIVYKRNRKKK